MIVPDLNLLIYAVNSLADEHEGARRWWESVLASREAVGLAWVVLLGFLRLTTSPRIFASPLAARQAWDLIDGWLSVPGTVVLNPGAEHAKILKTLILESGTAGNLTTDAHLAAICIERSATLYTADTDFARFASLRWENPLRS